MNNDFTPWLESVTRERHRKFFESAFKYLSSFGFLIENPDAIEGGYRLEFRKYDRHIITDRYMSFPVQGEAPGLALYDDANDYEIKISAGTPTMMLYETLNSFAADQE
jgi:hypothetical protein